MASYKKRKNLKAYAQNVRFHEDQNRFQYKLSKKKARIEIIPVEKGVRIEQFGKNGRFVRAAFQPTGGELTPADVAEDIMTVDVRRGSRSPDKRSIIQPPLGVKQTNLTYLNKSVPIEVIVTKPKIRGTQIRHANVRTGPIVSLKVNENTYRVPNLQKIGKYARGKDLGIRKIALPPSHPEYRTILRALNCLSWGGGQGPPPNFDDGEKTK